MVYLGLYALCLFEPRQILGTIVVHSPSCSLAPQALKELDKLCDLMRKARDGVRPRQILASDIPLVISYFLALAAASARSMSFR